MISPDFINQKNSIEDEVTVDKKKLGGTASAFPRASKPKRDDSFEEDFISGH